MGVENYNEGAFWKAIEEVLGRSGPQWQKRWGEVFLETLKKHRLSIFHFQGAHKYVSQILAHGGIPDSCLRDFFENFLWPTVNGTFDADLEQPEEIIEEWRSKQSLYQSTDRPVRRFLESGGKAATDFLARCIEMARIAYDEGKIPQASELGLPARIVETFEEWFRKRDGLERSGRSVLFRRPIIRLDDYGEAYCVLPEQILDGNSGAEKPCYRIIADENELFSEQVPTCKRQRHVCTEEREFYLPPANKYEVILQCGTKCLRRWSFDGIRRYEWIGFNESMRLITTKELPRDKLWIVVPAGMGLDSGVPILEKVNGTGQWDKYVSWRVDASEVESLSLSDSSGKKKELLL